ncbi:hypothetical protein BC936DRAFT_138543, partial [Jimgerdemannia flammicorona]
VIDLAFCSLKRFIIALPVKDDIDQENEETVFQADEDDQQTSRDGSPGFIKRRKVDQIITPHKPTLTRHMFDAVSSTVIPGLKSLKCVLTPRYQEVADEVGHHETEQKGFSSLGETLTKWLRGVLLPSSPGQLFEPEQLAEYLAQPLQGERITDRDKKLRDVFETTLREFYIMIKHSPGLSLPRHSSERKFLVERVATPFKLVEYVFGHATIHWIEKEIMSTKAVEFVDDPTGDITSKKADALATDFVYNVDVMSMESSGGPLQQNRKHTLDDSNKIIHTGVAILLACLRRVEQTAGSYAEYV